MNFSSEDWRQKLDEIKNQMSRDFKIETMKESTMRSSLDLQDIIRRYAGKD